MQLLLALWLGKIIFTLTRLLGHGGGSAGPGYYALKIEPNLVTKLAGQIPQNVVITGTNGKTTTARLLDHFVKLQKLKIVRNSTGSNLERGIASALIASSSWSGKIEADLGIWELDEAAFNKVVFQLKPQIMVFLNAFRDQLDRYGEVDSVVKKWWETLERVDWEAFLLVNHSDQNTGALTAITEINPKLSVQSFGIRNHFVYREVVVDAKKEIKHFKAEFEAENIKSLGLKGTNLSLKYPDGKLKLTFHIPGLYHIYDLLAAFGVYYQLNLPVKDLPEQIKSFSPAFGRVEEVKLNGHNTYIFLIKNPAGTNQVLETLAPELKADDRLLIALNDNFADGTDVSWIWDAEFERLQTSDVRHQTICSGTRAQDLALRLKYAGVAVEELKLENDLKKAISEASSHTTGRLFILPTYTALLELQRLLAQMGVKSKYWEENGK